KCQPIRRFALRERICDDAATHRIQPVDLAGQESRSPDKSVLKRQCIHVGGSIAETEFIKFLESRRSRHGVRLKLAAFRVERNQAGIVTIVHCPYGALRAYSSAADSGWKLSRRRSKVTVL